MNIFDMSTTLIDEIRYADVLAKQSSINKLFPTFDDRVKAVAGKGGVRLKQVRGDLWTFKVHSGTKDGVWYTNNVKFPNLEEDIIKYAKDKKLWNKEGTKVDLRKLAVEILFSTDVQLYCSCPAFLYYGAAYILTQRGAKYTKPENRPPKKRNPSELGAMCFDERAQVLMADGSFKSIKDIKTGDLVFTHTGSIKPVLFTTVDVSSNIYNTRVEGVYGDFGVTGNHEFYVKQRNERCLCGCGVKLSVKMAECKGLERVYNGKFTSSHTGRTVMLKDISNTLGWVKFENLTKLSLLVSPKLKFNREKILNCDLARLIGYFLAEGSFHTRRTNKITDSTFLNKNGRLCRASNLLFTVSQDEVHTIGKDIVQIIKDQYGVSSSVKVINYIKGLKHSRYATISASGGESLVREFINFVGYDKSKLFNLLNIDDVAKTNLLGGLFAGDGYMNKNGNCVMLYSSKKEIAEFAFSALISLGIRANLQCYKSSCTTNNFVGKRYIVSFVPNDKSKQITDILKNVNKKNSKNDRTLAFKHKSYERDGEVTFRRLSKLEKIAGVKKVYNLEVADDHSYIVNGVAVHNCKHGQLLLDVLPMYATTLSKYISQYYGDVIEDTENEVKGKKNV